jgi:hypothetical protein
MQVMLEAGENFLKVEQVEGADGQPDLLITMDRTKVNTRGKHGVWDPMLELTITSL